MEGTLSMPAAPKGVIERGRLPLRHGPVPIEQMGKWRLREGCDLPRVSVAWNWAFRISGRGSRCCTEHARMQGSGPGPSASWGKRGRHAGPACHPPPDRGLLLRPSWVQRRGEISLAGRLGPGLSGAPGEQCNPGLSEEGPRTSARVVERISVPPGGHGADMGRSRGRPGAHILSVRPGRVSSHLTLGVGGGGRGGSKIGRAHV